MSNKKLHQRSGLHITNTGEAYDVDGNEIIPIVKSDGHLYVGDTCLYMAVARCHVQGEMFGVYVRFKDGNKLNVAAGNLEWVTGDEYKKTKERKVKWYYILWLDRHTSEEFDKAYKLCARIKELTGNKPRTNGVYVAAATGCKCSGFTITRRKE